MMVETSKGMRWIPTDDAQSVVILKNALIGVQSANLDDIDSDMILKLYAQCVNFINSVKN